MICPKCKSNQYVKDGIVKGKQRFLCKVCKYRYTVEYRGKSVEIKRMALHLYLEGLGFRSISRILKVSNVTILNWIKAFGSEIENIQCDSAPIKVVELDEVHTYIKSKKNYCWIWVAVDRDGRRYVDFVLGSRGTETGSQLWEKIESMCLDSRIMTDYWKAYSEFLPPSNHKKSKAETFTVEGYNSRLRHFCARLRRKSKCYTKSVVMLKYSLILAMWYLNNKLSILI
ncbi:MAG: IS1 family transposase [Candidatus Kapabacteria bacterium]|nr:IS1 family transposase [Candidatus Kapabacteria bacterium]